MWAVRLQESLKMPDQSPDLHRASVPMVCVHLVQTMRLDPGSWTRVKVQLTQTLAREYQYSWNVNPDTKHQMGFRVDDILLQPSRTGEEELSPLLLPK